MKTHDFYYDLPEELIAQTPLDRRDGSRLLVLDKETGTRKHMHFYELPQLLRPGDCLVMTCVRRLQTILGLSCVSLTVIAEQNITARSRCLSRYLPCLQ